MKFIYINKDENTKYYISDFTDNLFIINITLKNNVLEGDEDKSFPRISSHFRI